MRARFHWPSAAVLAAAVFLTACSHEKTDSIVDVNSSEVTFPNGTRILAENMHRELDLMRGMMFRESLAPERGLLFMYKAEGMFPYFMYQTKIPLDIIWMNRRRVVVEIAANTPPCPSKSARECPSYGGHEKARYVLEVNAGVAAKNGVRVGDVLDF